MRNEVLVSIGVICCGIYNVDVCNLKIKVDGIRR